MKWTNELAALARNVANDSLPHPYGHDYSDTDCRSRAREFARAGGMVLDTARLEYLECFVQRLDGGRAALPSHSALRDATTAARKS